MSKSVQPRLESDDEAFWEIPQDPVVNIFTFGWMEDGRLGYSPDKPGYEIMLISSFMKLKFLLKQKYRYVQKVPRPVISLKYEPKTSSHYVGKSVSAGTRHSLFLMINCLKSKSKASGTTKQKKVMLAGLNQLGLCDEPGFMEPVDVPWDPTDSPRNVVAGNGFSFIITKIGNLYSFGNDKFGVLGHGDIDVNIRVPR